MGAVPKLPCQLAAHTLIPPTHVQVLHRATMTLMQLLELLAALATLAALPTHGATHLTRPHTCSCYADAHMTVMQLLKLPAALLTALPTPCAIRFTHPHACRCYADAHMTVMQLLELLAVAAERFVRVGGARPFETGLHMLTEQPGGGARYLSERETHMV